MLFRMIVPGHILKVGDSVVKSISVDMVTDHVIRRIGDESVHTLKLLFAIFHVGSDNVLAAEASFEEPAMFAELIVNVGVDKNNLVGFQRDFTEGCFGIVRFFLY